MSARTMLPVLVAFAALAAMPAAQTAPQKKFGAVYRSEVDSTIAALRSAATADGAFGDGSCRQTAMVLTAMGHSHRYYALSDGPYTRDAVRFLFKHRQSDGSFGQPGDAPTDRAATTQWVVEALDVMDPVEHRTDVTSARRWLEQHDAGGPTPWQASVDAVLDAFAHGTGDPQTLGAAAAADLRQGPARAAANLVQLVACQAAARLIDAGKARPAAPQATAWTPSQQKGLDFLLKQQDGGEFFVDTPGGRFPDSGLSALGIAALQTKPQAARSKDEQAAVDAGLQKLLAQQNEDGSFAQRNANYTTCAAILALAMAGREEYKPAIQRAQRYVVGIQNVESRGYARSDRDYGSIGYGGSQRGDVSNTQFAVEALRVSGLPQDDEAFAKALVFLQRSQNLRSVNDFSGRVRDEGEWMDVTSGDDGGSAYYPGNSAAGYIDLPDGKRIPRSYGSMTYALLKTYTLIGLGADDPRIQAAMRWAERNWSLDENPGADARLGEKVRFQGLYYYYMVLAQALDSAEVDVLRVPTGDGAETVDVRWRDLLRAHLEKVQNADGSWLNEKNGRWWEEQPAICTIYALLALHRAG